MVRRYVALCDKSLVVEAGMIALMSLMSTKLVAYSVRVYKQTSSYVGTASALLKMEDSTAIH